MKFLITALLIVSNLFAYAGDNEFIDEDWAREDKNWERIPDPRDPLNPRYISKNHLYDSEFSFSQSEVNAMKFAAGMAIVAFATEREMLEFVQKNNGKFADNLARKGEFFGSRNLAVALGGSYVLGVVMGNGKIAKTSVIAIEAMAFNWMINDSLKQVFRRALPRETNDPFKITESDDAPDMGMPSGHTTTAFAVATVIADQYGDDSLLVPVIAYGLASLTAWSRVYDNSHWASDVFIGAIVGHFTGKAVSGKLKDNRYGMQLAITPYVKRDGGGVMVRVNKKETESHCREKDWNCFGRKINGR